MYRNSYWVAAEIRPDGLDREVWTKSGPSLDCVWTVFSKMVAEIIMVCSVKVHKKILKSGENISGGGYFVGRIKIFEVDVIN